MDLEKNTITNDIYLDLLQVFNTFNLISPSVIINAKIKTEYYQLIKGGIKNKNAVKIISESYNQSVKSINKLLKTLNEEV